MPKKSQKFIIVSSLMVLLLVVILSFRTRFGADELNDNVVTENISLNNQPLTIVYKGVNSQSVAIKEGNIISNTLDLIEKGYSNCNNKFGLNNIESNYVCLVADVGVHSQQLYLLEYNHGILSFLPNTIDEITENYFLSDRPNFEFIQINSEIRLNVDYRNYDKDPLIDINRSTFRLENHKFLFDKKSELQYD